MARIPRSQPGGTIISREVPVRTIQQSQFDTGDAISGAGKAIGEYSDMLQKAFIVAEKTKAQNIFNSRVAEIGEKAAAEPNFDTATRTKYYNELEKARQEASSSISLQEVKNNFLTEAEGDILTARIKLDYGFNKKAIDSGKADWIVYDNDAKDAYISAISPEQRRNIILKHDQKLEEMVAGGFLSREDAATNRAERASKWAVAQVDADIGKDMATDLDNSYVYSQLKLGNKGTYENLPEQERGKALERIQLKINRNKRLFEFNQNVNQEQNLANMIIAKTENTLSYEQIKSSMLNGDIKPKDGEKLIKELYTPNANETNFKIYSQIREMQTRKNSVDEINNFILNNSDKLTANDTKALINKTFSEQDKNRNMRLNFSVEALKGWVKNSLSLMPEVSSEIVYDFFNRVDKENAQGARIDEILKDVQKDYIKKYNPQTALLEDVPNIIASRNKIQRVYEKESKIKTKSTPQVKSNVIISNSGIDFDDL